MKIAVTYDNGNIFQHFGKTENFKVYEVEDNQVVSSEVIGSNGTGHGALAGLLSEQGVDVLICGGIGGGAQAALAEAGVELCSGAEGDVDAAVEAYLNGTLTSAGATCDHHDHEEGHSCGDHCGSHEEEESSCGGSCGTCGGGCGAPTPVMEGKNVGKTCRTHYRGTFNDGTQFDSSYDRGEPLEFICGVGQMIRGFDAAVAEMEVGEKVNIHLMPEEAYGMPDPNAIFLCFRSSYSSLCYSSFNFSIHIFDSLDRKARCTTRRDIYTNFCYMYCIYMCGCVSKCIRFFI